MAPPFSQKIYFDKGSVSSGTTSLMADHVPGMKRRHRQTLQVSYSQWLKGIPGVHVSLSRSELRGWSVFPQSVLLKVLSRRLSRYRETSKNHAVCQLCVDFFLSDVQFYQNCNFQKNNASLILNFVLFVINIVFVNQSENEIILKSYTDWSSP